MQVVHDACMHFAALSCKPTTSQGCGILVDQSQFAFKVRINWKMIHRSKKKGLWMTDGVFKPISFQFITLALIPGLQVTQIRYVEGTDKTWVFALGPCAWAQLRHRSVLMHAKGSRAGELPFHTPIMWFLTNSYPKRVWFGKSPGLEQSFRSFWGLLRGTAVNLCGCELDSCDYCLAPLGESINQSACPSSSCCENHLLCTSCPSDAW